MLPVYSEPSVSNLPWHYHSMHLMILLAIVGSTCISYRHPMVQAQPRCVYHGVCQGPALDFQYSISSHITCKIQCRKNQHCKFFSYNTSKDSFLSRHCFLYRECNLSLGSEKWVTYSINCSTQQQLFVAYHLLFTIYCQAQPQPQLQLSWAEIALISAKFVTTHPPPTHPGK